MSLSELLGQGPRFLIITREPLERPPESSVVRSAILALVLFAGLAATARADPAVATPTAGSGLAIWTFSNPTNYTIVNVTLSGAGASLPWRLASFGDTSPGDFAAARFRKNLDITTRP